MEKTIKDIIGDKQFISELTDSEMLELHKLARKPKRKEIDLSTITGIKKEWFSSETYFSVSRKRKDKCHICKANLREEPFINMVFSTPNYAVCKACCDDLLSKGVRDITKEQQQKEMEKNQLMQEIIDSDPQYFTDYSRKNSWNSDRYLPDKSIEQLTKIRDAQIAEKNRLDEIKRLIQEEYVETPMEQYLRMNMIVMNQKI